ncbi:MAG: TPM domain-containing protein [Verrucomicrobiota bacterium]
MKPNDFIHRLDHDKIAASIAAAEARTSGEIRVMVTHKAAPEPVTRAEQAFVRLGMADTAERNGVLIFVAPASQTFAVIGDHGVHRECGPAFWTELAAAMTGDFKAGDHTAAIIKGITRAGDLLATRFPRRADDKNELSNQVVTD